MAGHTLRDGHRLTFGTLTVFPVRPPTHVNASVGRTAMLLAAGPGLVLATLVGSTVWLLHHLHTPPLVIGVLCATLLAICTRGLHLDGLADTVDGLGVAHNHEKALRVMRQGDVGPMGVFALVATTLATSAAIATLVAHPVAIAFGVFTSRVCLILATASWFRPVQPDGLGRLVIGTVPRSAAILGLGLLLGAGYGLGVISLPDTQQLPGLLFAAAALLAAATTLAVAAKVQRAFGGITGDTLGAGVELSYAVSLIVFATALG